ncbi:MAG TPA: NAD-dependent epimerase/dehydratase family protein [Acidimicrobiales bacterium]
MAAVFVTGGTGLIGSNICKQLIERGDQVTALARPGSDTGALRDLGVAIAEGDITDPASVRKAAEGCEYAIHAAAVLGGASQDMTEHQRVNTGGVAHVLDAAQALGMRRVVTLGTTTYFEFSTSPLTERSPLHPSPSQDPYTQTKRAAFVEAMRRVEEGMDVCVVIPGGTFGPAPCVKRSLEAPSYNLRIVLASEGKFNEAVRFPIPWSFAADVAAASIAALDKGVAGEKYLAFARPEDVGSMAMFVNRAMEIAGLPNRVHDITADDLDADPELRARVGPSLDALARQQFPEPFFDNTHTRRQLGYEPKTLDEGLAITLAWLREQRLMQ